VASDGINDGLKTRVSKAESLVLNDSAILSFVRKGLPNWSVPLERLRSFFDKWASSLRFGSAPRVSYSEPLSLAPLSSGAAALCNGPFDACAALYALVLHFDGPARDRQLQRIAWHAEQSMMTRILRVEPEVVILSSAERLSLASGAVASLNGLQSSERQRFTANIRSLIIADDTVSLFECIILLLVESSCPREPRELRQSAETPTEISEQLITLLATIVDSHTQNKETALRSLNRGLSSLGLPSRASLPTRASFERLSWAMRGLRRASPPLIEAIIRACEVAITPAQISSTREQLPSSAILLGLRLCFSV
jgi:hypothetical protein